jgi:hypothetical protein
MEVNLYAYLLGRFGADAVTHDNVINYISKEYPGENPMLVTEDVQYIEDHFENMKDHMLNMPLDPMLQRIEDQPSLKIKRKLMEWFGESEHMGWDGWTREEARTLLKFLNDYLLVVEGTDFDPDQEHSLGSVHVKSKD